MLEFLGEHGWLHHERESWIWMRDRFIPYPLQNNVHHLPPEDLDKCLQGLVAITRHPRPKAVDFAGWIDANFGPGLAELFMRPYNEKVWAFSPEAMNASWVGRARSHDRPIPRAEKLNLQLRRCVLGPQQPLPISQVWRNWPDLGGGCRDFCPRIGFSFRRKWSISTFSQRIMRTMDGFSGQYDALISTMPLRELIKVCHREDLMPLADKGLLYSSVNIIGIGLRGRPKPELAKKCWMYFPENNCPFYRVTVFSNYSPANVPDPEHYWSLMCEVSESAKQTRRSNFAI